MKRKLPEIIEIEPRIIQIGLIDPVTGWIVIGFLLGEIVLVLILLIWILFKN